MRSFVLPGAMAATETLLTVWWLHCPHLLDIPIARIEEVFQQNLKNLEEAIWLKNIYLKEKKINTTTNRHQNHLLDLPRTRDPCLSQPRNPAFVRSWLGCRLPILSIEAPLQHLSPKMTPNHPTWESPRILRGLRDGLIRLHLKCRRCWSTRQGSEPNSQLLCFEAIQQHVSTFKSPSWCWENKQVTFRLPLSWCLLWSVIPRDFQALGLLIKRPKKMFSRLGSNLLRSPGRKPPRTTSRAKSGGRLRWWPFAPHESPFPGTVTS